MHNIVVKVVKVVTLVIVVTVVKIVTTKTVFFPEKKLVHPKKSQKKI